MQPLTFCQKHWWVMLFCLVNNCDLYLKQVKSWLTIYPESYSSTTNEKCYQCCQSLTFCWTSPFMNFGKRNSYRFETNDNDDNFQLWILDLAFQYTHGNLFQISCMENVVKILPHKSIPVFHVQPLQSHCYLLLPIPLWVELNNYSKETLSSK